MGRIVISQSDLPFPEDRESGNKISKFRYRVVNSNRNQFSDWSVINYAEQDVLKYEGSTGMPPGGTTGQVPSKNTDDDYDIGWNDVTDLIPPGTYAPGDDYVSPTTDIDKLVPSGGNTGEVLTKASNANGDTTWNIPYYVPTNGVNAQVLTKVGSGPNDYAWITLDPGAFGGSGSASDIIARQPYPSGGSVNQYTLGGNTYRVHAFYYVGNEELQDFTVYNGVIGKLMVIAGGGGGGGAQEQGSPSAGGGGAGGFWYGDYAFGTGTHTLCVGKGGLGGNGGAWWTGGQTQGTNGTRSYFDHNPVTNTGGILVEGGGGGGTSGRDDGWGGTPGLSGGSGGGGGRNSVGGNGYPPSGTDGGSNGGYGGGAVSNGASGGGGFTSSVSGVEFEWAKGGRIWDTSVPPANSGQGGGGSASNWGAVPGSGGSNGIILCRYRIA